MWNINMGYYKYFMMVRNLQVSIVKFINREAEYTSFTEMDILILREDLGMH